jgi:hypothetical protein
MYCAAGATGVDVGDRVRGSRALQSDCRPRSSHRQGEHHRVIFHAHKGKQPGFASRSCSRSDLATDYDFPHVGRLCHPWLGAVESLEKISRPAGELCLFEKRRQFQEGRPNAPCKWNADDEPVNQQLEPVSSGVGMVGHRSPYGFRFCS